MAKSAGRSSAFRTPISAVRSGDRWGSHTVADILGLSPGIRGPSLLLSPLCSRAAPISPGLIHTCCMKAVPEWTNCANTIFTLMHCELQSCVPVAFCQIREPLPLLLLKGLKQHTHC